MLRKFGYTMQLFWIPLLAHAMMLTVSAHLIKKGMIPWSMTEWRFAVLMSLLILSVLAFRLSNQNRDASVMAAFLSAVPWLIWFAASLLYAFLQWDITFLPADCFLDAVYGTYFASTVCGMVFLARK